MSRMGLLLLFSALLILFKIEKISAQEKEAAPAAETKVKEEKGPTHQEILNLQARLQGLKATIKSKSEQLKKLISEKQGLKDEKKSVEIFNSMKAEYKDLQVAIKEYDEQLSILNYRYPEKGLNKERKYERIEVKTLDQIESEFSLEGKVKKTMNLVRQQFPEKNGTSKKLKSDEKDVPSQPKATTKETSRSLVTEPQLLSK